MTDARRLLLPVLAFLVLGWTWALASPVGSSPDENFHLTSVWCAWGEHEGCRIDESGDYATVPSAVGSVPCFVLNRNVDASCRDSQPADAFTTTSHVNSSIGNYPPLFHVTMRAFVGSDVERSVVAMRMVNVVLAAGILLWALWVSSPMVRRAAALTWAAAVVPLGLFTLASVNPSSWAVIGGGTFWVFLYAALERTHEHDRSAWWAWGGAAVTAGMAVLARSDQVWTIALSVLAVLILQGGVGRRRWLWILFAALAAAGVAILATFRVGTYLSTLALTWPEGSQVNDQPNPLVKVLAEFPAFIGGHFGLQDPWTQRSDFSNYGVEGWTKDAFSLAMGNADIVMPSIVGVVMVAVLSGLVMLGLTSVSRRKVVAAAIPVVGILVVVVAMRALGGWGSWTNPQGYLWHVSPRYTLPLVLVAVGILLLVPQGARMLNRAQAGLVVAGLVVAANVALLATMTRFMVGQEHSWVQLEPGLGWWWAFGPDPLLLVVISAVASTVYFTAMVSIGRDALPANDGVPSIHHIPAPASEGPPPTR